MMKIEQIAILGIFLTFIVLEILFTNFFKKPAQKKGDGTVELVSTFTLILLTQPLILFSAALIMRFMFPDFEGVLSGSALWLQFLLLLIFDDMTQYWWHRASHSIPWLYNFHRAHHNADYLSIRITYRNNLFYYLFMPGLWFSGILIYLGLGWSYAIYLIVKMSVIYGAHSDVHWDAPLYRIKLLSPLMWIVERVISTPATHSAHHGKYAEDPATYYKGNYGNLLFFWDILFGTAKITRTYPAHMGVENLPDIGVGQQLAWPLLRGRKKKIDNSS